MGTPRVGQRGPRGRIVLVGLATMLVGGVAVSTVSAIERELSKGRVPSAAFGSSGVVDARQIPDFVQALGRDGEVVGYVPRTALGIYNGTADLDVIPVYADDLATLVGHMVAGIGFVPLGADAGALPAFEVTTSASHAPGPPSD